MKSNEPLAENKIKSVEQLLSKYKQGNNIHEHGQIKRMKQNKWNAQICS